MTITDQLKSFGFSEAVKRGINFCYEHATETEDKFSSSVLEEFSETTKAVVIAKAAKGMVNGITSQVKKLGDQELIDTWIKESQQFNTNDIPIINIRKSVYDDFSMPHLFLKNRHRQNNSIEDIQYAYAQVTKASVDFYLSRVNALENNPSPKENDTVDQKDQKIAALKNTVAILAEKLENQQ